MTNRLIAEKGHWCCVCLEGGLKPYEVENHCIKPYGVVARKKEVVLNKIFPMPMSFHCSAKYFLFDRFITPKLYLMNSEP